MTVLLVTGSRDGHPHVAAMLDRWVAKFGAPETVVLGDALGVDTGARTWCAAHGYDHEVMKADWESHGKRAGPMRNATMIAWAKGAAWSHGTVVHCVAFPVGEAKGTRGCMALALAAGFRVFEVDLAGRPTEVV